MKKTWMNLVLGILGLVTSTPLSFGQINLIADGDALLNSFNILSEGSSIVGDGSGGTLLLSGNTTISPGVDGPGTLDLEGLQMFPPPADDEPFARFKYDLRQPGVVGSGVNDLVRINGTGTLFFGEIGINDGPDIPVGTYTVMEFEGPDEAIFLLSLPDDTPTNRFFELNTLREIDNAPITVEVSGAVPITSQLTVSKDSDIGATGDAIRLEGGRLTVQDTFSSSRPLQVSAPVNGTLEVAANKTLTLDGALAGRGKLFKTGEGRLVLDQTVPNVRPFAIEPIVQEGTLAFRDPRTVGELFFFQDNINSVNTPVTLDGGTLENLDGQPTDFEITVTAAGGQISTPAGTEWTMISGAFAGSGDWSKVGDGTFNLSSNYLGTGDITIANGTLQLQTPTDGTNLRLDGLIKGGPNGQLRVPDTTSDAEKTVILSGASPFSGETVIGDNVTLQVEGVAGMNAFGPGGFTGGGDLELSGPGDWLIGDSSMGRVSFSGDGSVTQHGDWSISNLTIGENASVTLDPNFSGDFTEISVLGSARANLSSGSYNVVRVYEQGWLDIGGDGAATLDMSFTIFFDSANIRFTLGEAGVIGGPNNDLLIVDFYQPISYNFYFDAAPGFGPGVYTIVTSDTRLSFPEDTFVTGSGLNYIYDGLPDQYEYQLVSNPDLPSIELHVIPEPGFAALIFGLLGLGAVLRRRPRTRQS
ncbi:MAG: hypothetical protein ACFE0O_06605 [Opitutales bacterium]